MRRLTSDEVRGLERFLAADNDEVVGVEIHIGKDWRLGYSEPDTLQKFRLEELADGAFIEMGRVKVCAVVGDRVYCIQKGKYFDEVHDTSTEYAYRGVNPDTGDYQYIRVIVTYDSPVSRLPEETILPLERILVENNQRVVAVRIEPGSSGIGGSNTSGFSADRERMREYTLDELNGRSPIPVEDDELCALVNDVLYLRYTSKDGERRVYTVDYRAQSCVSCGDGIAYDTVSATRISLIRKDRE